MTWEEIKPVAEAILGEGCGEMTLPGLWDAARERGYTSITDFVEEIETAGRAYDWLKDEYPGREDKYRECLERYAKLINRKQRIK